MPGRVQRAPLHPGVILREQFMADFGLNANRLAGDLRVPPTRIGEIVNERRAITLDTALRLARYFGTTAEFWINRQTARDLDVARDSLQRRIEADVRPIAAARSCPAKRAPRPAPDVLRMRIHIPFCRGRMRVLPVSPNATKPWCR